MAQHIPFGGSSIREDGYYDDSKALDEFRKGDHGAMDEDFARLMPKRYGRMELRHIGVVRPICEEQASLYVKRPLRVIGGLGETGKAALGRALMRADYDQLLLRVDQSAIAQNSAMVEICDKGPERFKANVWAPYEWEIEHDDPMETDPAMARRVSLRIPLVRDSGIVHFGRRVYERDEQGVVHGYDEAIVKGETERWRELFPPGHYDRLPLAMLSLSEPERGRAEPELPMDLLQMQRGLTLHVSDVLYHAMHGSNSWNVATGGALDSVKLEEIPIGGIVKIQDSATGDRVDFKIHNPNPPLEKYITAVQFAYDMFRRSRHLSYVAGVGITGDAKAIERFDIDQHTESRRTLLESFERRLISIVGMVLGRSTRAIGIAEPVLEELQHNIVEPKRNALQEVQADVLRWFLGEYDPGRTVAASENIDYDKALAMMEQRTQTFMERMRFVREGGVPGFDALASQLAGGRASASPNNGE